MAIARRTAAGEGATNQDKPPTGTNPGIDGVRALFGCGGAEGFQDVGEGEDAFELA